jgi:hypothetical protein
MKIPYAALRFSQKEIQDWGVNFERYDRGSNENAYWNKIDPNQNGYVNQFGDITGLKNIIPPLRLSLLPYISAGSRTVPYANRATSNTFLRSGGMDVKYGVNESFTLDATLIPDFGQVVSDNVVLNLSPFEIQFQENRPFLQKGLSFLTKPIFYILDELVLPLMVIMQLIVKWLTIAICRLFQIRVSLNYTMPPSFLEEIKRN